ncbi:hypothetical protein C345_06465 [Cryptococcus neoformans A2-102-5]|nr:hypothetical protein C346_06490 [Cryptococcus neoformans var. grubii D17-1]OXG90829.1 hypothetical protein C345_06465 [Cryptococcus neoformans var. grubii A2-102-5]
MSLKSPADGQIIAAIIEILDKHPYLHPSFNAPAFGFNHLAYSLHVSPFKLSVDHTINLVRPLAETLFDRPREPVVKELSSRRGLGKEVWVVFEMVPGSGNWTDGVKDKASSEEGSRLELQRPSARRARTERFLDTSASCSPDTDEYMPFVSYLKWGKDDSRQEGEEGGKQDSGDSGVLRVPNRLGKPKRDSDGKSLKKVEEEVDGNEDEKGGEEEEEDGKVVEKEETRSKGKRRHKQTHKHGTESDQTRPADEKSKRKESTHKRPKNRHRRSSASSSSKKKKKRLHKEDELESPSTPWFEIAFEGLPFGPDVPASKMLGWMRKQWRLLLAEAVFILGLVYIIQATGL